MVEPGQVGTSILIAATKRVYNKAKEMRFFDGAVENAASQVAENHDTLEPDVFIHTFQKDEVIEAVEDFEDDGELIDLENISAAFEDNMLAEEVEPSPDELILEFLHNLEIEISQDQKIGSKLCTIYLQQIHNCSKELKEGQEEVLYGIQEIKARVPTDKGYEIFQPIGEHFGQELNGEDPLNRYDLPLFGRENELKKVQNFPDSSEDVLILTGRAGIGKTRLVVEGSLLLEAEHPDWQVYWTDIDVGNVDIGLENLDLDDRNTILFVDDARNTGQIRRLFDLVDQHQSHLKLIFAERPHFTSKLQSHGRRLRGIDIGTVELPRLDTSDIHGILREYYDINRPPELERIAAISEGIPLFAHLLAKQRTKQERTDSVAEEGVLEEVFEDILNSVQKIDSTKTTEKLETYIKHLAAVGSLDLHSDEQVKRFREMIGADKTTHEDLTEILINHIGPVVEHGSNLTIEPDALQEYIVYDSFFSGSTRDYQDKIYDNFSEFTGKSQINQLAVIHHRYDCRDARKTIRSALTSELNQLNEYGFAERVKLLRRFEALGSAYPHYAIRLIKESLSKEPPEDQEDEQLSRTSMYTTSPAGNFIVESIDFLSKAIQEEPEEVTIWLLQIAINYPSQSNLQTGSVEQKLRQAMQPGFQKSPTAQQKILNVIGESFLGEEIKKELRLSLLDIIAEASKIEIHEFAVDPVNRSKMRSWQGDLRMTKPQLELREQAIEYLIEIIWNDQHPEVRRKAAKKLMSFENSQTKYHSEHQEVISEEEFTRVIGFASEYVSQDEDLQCIDILSQLANTKKEEIIEIKSEILELEEKLAENERYQLLQSMKFKPPKKIEDRESEIREFAGDLDENKLEPSDFSEIASEYTNSRFNQFFKILSDDRPAYGEKLLEADEPNLSPYKPQILMGICSTDPERGKELVDQYADERQFDRVSAGLRTLAIHDIDFVKEKVNKLLKSRTEVPRELVSGLSSVVNGYWEDHQDWTESVLLAVLQDSNSLDAQSVKDVLRPLPLYKDTSEDIDGKILAEVLGYAENKERLDSESHGVMLVIQEVAERDPEQFVNFAVQRLENDNTGTSLLPTHLEIEVDRMKEADGYESAVNKICDRILSTDYYPPIAFSDLTGCFPIADITEYFLTRIPDCSEDQLLQVIQYCKLLPVTEETEDIYLKVLTEGVENIQEAESVQGAIRGALYTDATASVGLSGNSGKEDEIEMMIDWQNDPSLPSSVHLFAEETEDMLLDALEERENLFRD